jgi:hypothetical protein
VRSIILLVLVSVSAASGTAWARTWYIMPSGSGDAPTIQAGVDSAGQGDTVLVAAGVYHENISLGKAVCLASESGPQLTSIIGSPGPYSVVEVTPPGEPTQTCACVEGFWITGPFAGIACFSCDGDIVGNIVYDCPQEGIAFHSGSRWEWLEGAVEGNLVVDCWLGINIHAHLGTGFVLTNNTVFSCDYTGIVVANPDGYAPVVSRNIAASCAGWGIDIPQTIPPYNCPEPVRDCNDAWGNAGGDYSGFPPGPTDMSECPSFCYAHLGDFRLCDESPCLPDNNPDGCLIGAFGPGCTCGPTSREEVTWGSIKSIYR